MFKKPSSTHQNTSNGINPLDEIRQAEARATSQVLIARREAEVRLQASRDEAQQVIQQAQQAGAQAGQAQNQALIREAVQEAEQLTAEARRRAEASKQELKSRIGQAAHRALQIVLGLDEEEHKP